jgi:hypothetical protein
MPRQRDPTTGGLRRNPDTGGIVRVESAEAECECTCEGEENCGGSVCQHCPEETDGGSAPRRAKVVFSGVSLANFGVCNPHPECYTLGGDPTYYQFSAGSMTAAKLNQTFCLTQLGTLNEALDYTNSPCVWRETCDGWYLRTSITGCATYYGGPSCGELSGPIRVFFGVSLHRLSANTWRLVIGGSFESGLVGFRCMPILVFVGEATSEECRPESLTFTNTLSGSFVCWEVASPCIPYAADIEPAYPSGIETGGEGGHYVLGAGGTATVTFCDCIPDCETLPEDCDADPPPTPEDEYVQAHLCDDDSSVDLWMEVNAAEAVPFFFYDGACHYFDFGATSTTPGTLLTTGYVASESCEACYNENFYWQARACLDDELVDLWATVEVVETVYAGHAFKHDGDCYYFSDEDEPSDEPGTLIDDDLPLFDDCGACEVVCEDIGTFAGRPVNSFSVTCSGWTKCDCQSTFPSADASYDLDFAYVNGVHFFDQANDWQDLGAAGGHYYVESDTCSVPDSSYVATYDGVNWVLVLTDGVGALYAYLTTSDGAGILPYVWLSEVQCENGLLTIGPNLLVACGGPVNYGTVGGFTFDGVWAAGYGGTATISAGAP